MPSVLRQLIAVFVERTALFPHFIGFVIDGLLAQAARVSSHSDTSQHE
jgi:hypothetical protein